MDFTLSGVVQDVDTHRAALKLTHANRAPGYRSDIGFIILAGATACRVPPTGRIMRLDRIGTSAPAVSRALKQLESAQIVTRVPYREPGRRARDEYRLTEAGEDLLPVFIALVQWGDTHLQSESPPLSFVDADTGQTLGVCVTTDTGGPKIRSADIQIRRSADSTS
jgi:hypothetical protein